MRRLPVATLSLAGLSLVLAGGLSGCSSGEQSGGTATTESSKGEVAKIKKSSAEKKPVASGTGTLKGRITFTGAKPDIAAMNARLLDEMNKKTDDKQHCVAEASQEEKQQHEWLISDDGGLANVFVYLKPADGTYFELNESTPGIKNLKKEEIIDQPHCAFKPHAIAYFPSYTEVKDGKKSTKKTGQKLIVKNSAKMTHNTGFSGQDQDGRNEILPAGQEKVVDYLKPSSSEVTIRCNIHPWMSGVARVFDHPYYALTDKDGNFEIKNVPAGDVNIVVWHEGAKYINKNGAKGQKITLTDKENTQNFEAKASK